MVGVVIARHEPAPRRRFAVRAAANAAASCGRRSSASAPLPVSASTYSDGEAFGHGNAGDGGPRTGVPTSFDINHGPVCPET
jgi:hypothetical protein